MSFATKRARSKLSNRLTKVYAALFTAIFFLLSAGIFLLAFRYQLLKQSDHLENTMELIGDNLIEELEEGESLSSPEVLNELNTDANLSIFVYDQDGRLINRVLNFPLPDNLHGKGGHSPAAFLYHDKLMLHAEAPITERGASYGRLSLVYSMSSETSFLKLLGVLLLGANAAGALIALLVSRKASRRILAPIGQMIAEANEIGSSTLDARLEVPEPDDELKSLALTINGMLERVSAAYHQQGRFVADVSHELRTPLAVMQGNVDLLARWGAEDPAVRQDSIRALGQQTEYMSDLVENLLFLARWDNAQTSLNLSAFSVGELFGELLEEQALIDPAHAYELAPLPEDDTMNADRAMIRQMLRALIDNSVKYTPERGSITLGFSRAEGGVSLSVHDSGVGMSQEDCAHVFERFYRVDQARARATGGMGLGLSIVQAIAQAHGGGARAESEPDKGTTVTVTIPN
ncbi:MAG: HAMP domain-containing protein [Clostridiales bacterium]|nr:HAMP domain-containing protein [Clostridiales bacterium]